MPRPKHKNTAAQKTLQGLGLGENEAVLYTLMLAHPASTVQALCARAPFPRTMLYHVLAQLVQRGLVSKRDNDWRTTYAAESPEQLYEILTKKEHEFSRESESVRALIPLLKREHRLSGTRPSVRTFDGIKEYQKALEDCIMSKPKIVCSYECLADTKPAQEVRATHEHRRITQKIQKRVLFFENAKSLPFLRARGYDDFTQFRSITPGLIVPFVSDVTLYDGKMLYTSAADKHEPTALLIEDQALYTMQQNIFDTLWKSGRDRTLAFTETPL